MTFRTQGPTSPEFRLVAHGYAQRPLTRCGPDTTDPLVSDFKGGLQGTFQEFTFPSITKLSFTNVILHKETTPWNLN